MNICRRRQFATGKLLRSPVVRRPHPDRLSVHNRKLIFRRKRRFHDRLNQSQINQDRLPVCTKEDIARFHIPMDIPANVQDLKPPGNVGQIPGNIRILARQRTRLQQFKDQVRSTVNYAASKDNRKRRTWMVGKKISLPRKSFNLLWLSSMQHLDCHDPTVTLLSRTIDFRRSAAAEKSCQRPLSYNRSFGKQRFRIHFNMLREKLLQQSIRHFKCFRHASTFQQAPANDPSSASLSDPQPPG